MIYNSKLHRSPSVASQEDGYKDMFVFLLKVAIGVAIPMSVVLHFLTKAGL